MNEWLVESVEWRGSILVMPSVGDDLSVCLLGVIGVDRFPTSIVFRFRSVVVL